MPVFLAELKDSGRRAVAGLHQLEQEVAEELVGPVKQPLELGEGRASGGELLGEQLELLAFGGGTDTPEVSVPLAEYLGTEVRGPRPRPPRSTS